jgi:DNA-binding transcriptional ArsR family regulator
VDEKRPLRAVGVLPGNARNYCALGGRISLSKPPAVPAVGQMSRKKPNIDRVFHALDDPMRRAIVEKLSHGPISVSRLAAPLGITLAAVVQHLQVLEESGLVETEKIGRVRTCRIETTGLSAAELWIRDRRSMWERRLDRLGDLLAEPDEIKRYRSSTVVDKLK